MEMVGYEYVMHRHGALTDALLTSFDVLFVNVMHEAAPTFTPRERAAVHAWVQRGGALMCVCEHTNAYTSASKINPLLSPMGVTIEWTAALDVGEHCTEAPGWIAVSHLDRTHPINADCSVLHLKSAGTVSAHVSSLVDADGKHALTRGVAFLSERGWADVAGKHNAPDFYGDGVYNKGDAHGHLAVAATSEFGRGRVYVVGDQNAYGDAWLGVADNFKHACNAMEWSVVQSIAPVTFTVCSLPSAHANLTIKMQRHTPQAVRTGAQQVSRRLRRRRRRHCRRHCR
jgi:hypothetical protein